MILFLIALILIVGFILDRKYSKEPKNNCNAVRTPADPFIIASAPFIIASAQIPEKMIQISGSVPPKQFGELYNMRFRHIKKYKRKNK